MGVLSQKAFNANYALKKKYGTYQEYRKACGGSALNNTSGVLITTPTQETSPTQETTTPTETPLGSTVLEPTKSVFDDYMEEEKKQYEKDVERNNKQASNEASYANSQYNEILRNVNEINKANGMANTGYASDTPVSAYNAYRNSVNDIYNRANSSNNELYRYYIQNMQALQEQKDNKEITDSATVLQGLDNLMSEQGAKNANGTINSDYAKELWDYVTTYFGGEENIPNAVKSTLNSTKGFSEWLYAYNNGTVADYDKVNKISDYSKVTTIDENGNQDVNTGSNFAVVKNISKAESSSRINDTPQNNFRVTYNGQTYHVETGRNADKLSPETQEMLKSKIKESTGREPIEGDIVYYGDNLFVVTVGGNVVKIQARSAKKREGDYGNLLSEVKKGLGIG